FAALIALAPPLGCGGGGGTPSEPDRAALSTGALDAELVGLAWPIQMAEEAAVQPFAENPGWVALVMERDGRRAVEQLGAKGGMGAARAHAEAAALYRQAALTAANALVQT